MMIYQLYRIVTDGDDEFYVKIGLYSSEHQANRALERAREFWRNATEQGRLEIHPTVLDRVSWTSGFGEA